MSRKTDTFASILLAWFDRHGRHDLPWQHPRTPYRVWLSEIMLQQTQVKTAIPYFLRFVDTFPDLPTLAQATLDEVLAQWSGLGYYARARNLHATAKRCVQHHSGDLPCDIDALCALPGIGRSTAGAILAQAWNRRFPILDGNVKRLLTRYHGVAGWPGTPSVEKRLWQLAERHLPQQRLADYTQAQMDFGATQCNRAHPACISCPLNRQCAAWRDGRVGELPTSKAGKTLPEHDAIVLLIEDGRGRVLLQRRPAAGVWASLWSLPQAMDASEARHWFAKHMRGDYERALPLPELRHVFSHFRLKMQPLHWPRLALRQRLRDNDDLRWIGQDEFQSLGIPAPIRKLLESRSLRRCMQA
ncbi:MAG: A/G-specific adenine glycosylase [Xanthomonadaceae bacterium]|jgi:A/G-specific adenine glycosylase|nr:A/G-specific adenine glycosylase [Xanthomonadaceae bacterium]